MNDTIPPLARKLVDYLLQSDCRGLDPRFLEEQVAAMIDEHVPIAVLEEGVTKLRDALHPFLEPFKDETQLGDDPLVLTITPIDIYLARQAMEF